MSETNQTESTPASDPAVLDELLDFWEDVRCRTRMPLSIYLQKEQQAGTLTGVVVRLNALLNLRRKQQNSVYPTKNA